MILRHSLVWMLLAALIAGGAASANTQTQTGRIPSTLTDAEFWRLMTEISETGGTFPAQYMSNEDSAQFVIPALKKAVKPNGVYLGVGSEQNFTYIAAVKPRMAFVLDIRRDNLFEHLMYKALFEMSDDRADFVSRLFSRKRPAGLNNRSNVKALFDAFHNVETDQRLFDETLREILLRLTDRHHFQLNDADKAVISRTLSAFMTAGPDSLKGFGDTTNPTYAQLMAATDLAGEMQSYLATEENFRTVQDLEKRNLVIPLVGDFAGTGALTGIGRHLKEHGAILDVFYVSNVERYLFEQGDNAKRFYANVAALPLDGSSLFVRSVTSDISGRLGIPIPDSTAKWRTFLFPINEGLRGFTSGRIQTYRQLFDNPK